MSVQNLDVRLAEWIRKCTSFYKFYLHFNQSFYLKRFYIRKILYLPDCFFLYQVVCLFIWQKNRALDIQCLFNLGCDNSGNNRLCLSTNLVVTADHNHRLALFTEYSGINQHLARFFAIYKTFSKFKLLYVCSSTAPSLPAIIKIFLLRSLVSRIEKHIKNPTPN